MPNIGPMEIAIVLIIALVVFGPSGFPSWANRSVKGIHEFKGTISSEQIEIGLAGGYRAGARCRCRGAHDQGRRRRRGQGLEPETTMRRVKAISHEDQLSLVEHLEELRARIVVSLAVFGVALALCFWQNHLLLELANGPLPSGHLRLITFGITEPFTTTMTVSAYGAIILSAPIILFQIYAFLLPAFSKQQVRAVLPLLLLIPILFIAGIAFGYFVVLPAATKFLLNFNTHQFNIQVRARDYYGFFAQTLLACGVVFQVPVGILAVTRLGVVTVRQLTANRRYAYLGCAVLAAALPGVDPVSMLLETAPLIALYELSIVLARIFGEPTPTPLLDPG